MAVRLKEVIEVRRGIGDPVTADFVVVETLPETALPNTAYTTGDGRYWFHNGVEWRIYTLKFSDAYIEILFSEGGSLNASIRLIDELLARIDPADYLTTGTAGGQSVSFATLTEVVEYYRVLRTRLMEKAAAEAGMNSGLILETKKRSVGGVLRSDE